MIAALLTLPNTLVEVCTGVLVFFLLVFIGRTLRRRHGVELGWSYLLFSMVVAAYVPLAFIAFDLQGHSGTTRHLRAAMVLLGTLVGLSLLRRYYWELWFERQYQTRAPKFLSQVVSLVVMIAAGLVTVRIVYQQPIEAAILGSTVVVGIIGFAMQDLLGNVIAGIAIEIGKPYRVDDWLIVEQKRMEVIEVNWRSTRMRDNDSVCYDVPNRQMVGSTVVNLTYTSRVHGIRLRFPFEHGAAPNAVKDCLQHASLAAEGVLATPPPRVFLVDFAESFNVYEIRFWIDDESRYNPICDAVRTNVWYESQRAGLKRPVPIRRVMLDRPKPEGSDALETARTSVRRQPFLQLLSPSQLDQLLHSARLQRFGRGERIIEQGQEGRSMFILVHGEADVFVNNVNGEQLHVATLKDGDYAGEMSLLTGEARTATVKARTDCETWEIGKETLGPILAENKTLVEGLSEILAKRKMEVDGIIEASLADDEKTATVNRYKRSFLDRLYDFFEL